MEVVQQFQRNSPVTIAETLPGMQRENWSTLTGPVGKLIPLSQWSDLSTQEKIEHEHRAVVKYLSQKDQPYVLALMDVASSMRPMPSTQCVTVVMPAYNEQDGIGAALEAFARQIPRMGGTADPAKWGMIVVVNRPLTNDSEREVRDRNNMEKTIEIIKGYQSAFPEIDLNYVRLEVPHAIAGIGPARMVGHDLAAVRSIRREAINRTPAYIQTCDSDNSTLHPEYLNMIISQIESDNYSKDYYRQAQRFPLEDLRECPLLHATDMLWTNSFRAIAWNGGSPWTAGAGILFSHYAHFSAGGVFPFKFKLGVDEDIRIGLQIRILREEEGLLGQGDFRQPLFETDPRRNMYVIGDLLKTMKESGLVGATQPFSLDVREIATGLRSHQNFHDTAIRGKNFPMRDNLEWLDSQQEFELAVPTLALQVLANSYHDFIRMDLALYHAKREFQSVADIYNKFASGEVAYSTMQTMFQFHAADISGRNESVSETDRIAMQRIFSQAGEKAADLVCEILENHGITAEKIGTNYRPPAADEDFPILVKIVSTEGYRAYLKTLLNLDAIPW